MLCVDMCIVVDLLRFFFFFSTIFLPCLRRVVIYHYNVCACPESPKIDVIGNDFHERIIFKVNVYEQTFEIVTK